MKHQLAAFVALIGCIFASALGLRADEVIYDNTSSKLDITYGSLQEFGDQIFFAGGEKLLTSLVFEYYGRDFSGDEKIRLSIYSNDGSLTGTIPDANRPGTLLYASDWDDLAESTAFGSTLFYELTTNNIVATNNFTWTVEFQGMTASEFAGLSLYNPPTLGNSFDDFWEKDVNGVWQLRQANSGVAMNFGVRVRAISPVIQILAQPQSVATAGGSEVNFTVEAEGASIAYQWFRDGILIPGATQSTYHIAAAQQSDVGAYRASLTNAYGPEVFSDIATLSVDFTIPTDFTLITNGIGSIIHNPHPSLTEGGNPFRLFVGRTYTLKALETGSPNFVLKNWTATWEGQSSPIVLQNEVTTFTFMMRSNMVITANFIANPFLPAAGSYFGLFSDTLNGVSIESAGFFRINVNKRRFFSGKLVVHGYPVRISGKFNLDGTFTGITKSRLAKIGKPELNYSLALDFAEGISGTISEGSSWTSVLEGDRAVWKTLGLPQATDYVHTYTMLLPGFDDKNDGPVGTGTCSFYVSASGKIRVSGRTADGEIFKQITILSQGGLWPAYFPMRRETRIFGGKQVVENKSIMIGWLQLADNALGNKAPIGDLKWVRLESPSSPVYPSGFTNDIQVIGSRWVPPIAGSEIRAVDFDSATLGFTEGNLANPFAAEYFITTKTVFARDYETTYLPSMRAKLLPRSGMFRGTFEHPLKPGVSTRFFGALLQDHDYGDGFFVGPTEGGKVKLLPRTP